MLERTSGTHNYTEQRLAAERTHLHALCSVPVFSNTILTKNKRKAQPGFITVLCLSQKGMVIIMLNIKVGVFGAARGRTMITLLLDS